MPYLVNIDIGGTHTDGVAIDDGGRIVDGKVPSTPDDFSRGFFDSLELIAEKLDRSVPELLDETALVSHGTTVGTNAVIEGDDADAALVTTKGAEDTITLMRGSKGLTDGLSVEEYLDSHELARPEPLVPKEDVFGMDERIDCKGETVVEFNEETAREIATEIDRAGRDAVAVSFLWSFLNDDHEERMAEILREELDDDVFVTTSSSLSPISGEYERTAAVAINAITGPATSEYIAEIDDGLTDRGYDGTLLVMNVGGGLLPAADAIEQPVQTIDSGPVAGITGCSYLGDLLGHENIIAADMGGTSFDVGLVTDGEPITNSTNVIRQYSYRIRNIDVESIGSGGGSIAWVDDVTGRLRVGPQSAGADPGPACYDRGGTAATITDADLLCGFIDPDQFLGGRETLDAGLAETAVQDVADDLGVTRREAVDAIVEISNAKMADLIQRQTIQSGYDPRQFQIYAYGGAGPLHLPMIANQLDVDSVVVPTGESSAVWSSVGISSTDVLHREEVSNIRTFAPFDPERLTEQYEGLEADIRAQLEAEGFEDEEITIERYANLRYGLQIHEVAVPVPGGRLSEADVTDLVDRFEARYEQLYGEDAGAEETGHALVTIRCDGYGRTTKPQLERTTDTSEIEATADPSTEEIYWPPVSESLDTTVYDHTDVHPGLAIDGPAVVRLRNTTVTVPPRSTARIDGHNNIIIDS
jgi:N-methylhydantoinase A